MKKHRIRFVAFIVAVVLATTTTIGCKKNSESFGKPQEFVYVAESVPLPSIAGDIRDIFITGDKLYFTSETFTKNNTRNNYSGTYADNVYSMNYDGTGFAKLSSYVPSVFADGDTSASSMIQAIVATNDGYIWVVERWYQFEYDLPEDFSPERDEPWEYYVELRSGNTIRRLDSTGAETFIADISSLQGQQRFFFICAIEIDKSGNLYICADDLDAGGQLIYVLDSIGNLQFQLKPREQIEKFIRLPGGQVAFAASRLDGTGGNAVFVLQTIDFTAKDFGEVVRVPGDGRTVYSGSGSYDVFIGDESAIYGYTFGDEETVKLLSWQDSNIVNENISNLTMLSDEQIVCTSQIWDVQSYKESFEVFILTKTLQSEISEKTVLTLATFDTLFISPAVEEFNRASSDFRIYIKDYSEFNTDDDTYAGFMRLRTEIISGAGPDIIDVRRLNYKELIEKGLLADLYPFIDSDPDIARDDFVRGVLDAAEVDGGLYQVFPQFMVNTIVGNPSVVGEDPSWTMDEFIIVLNTNPDADIPLGAQVDKIAFLQMAVLFNIDEYIDWTTGTAHFDTPEFLQLMEYAEGRFPDEPDNMDYDVALTIEAIATGRQLVMQNVFGTFENFQYYKTIFGGEIVFKGYPSESRNGNTLRSNPGLAIMEQSGNKEAAWAFLRMILDEDWQYNNVEQFPTNQEVFNHRVKLALEQQSDGGETMLGYGILAKNLTNSDIDQIMVAISSVSGTMSRNLDEAIWSIINESATSYFKGTCSAEDAAKVIQSKISIMVSERS